MIGRRCNALASASFAAADLGALRARFWVYAAAPHASGGRQEVRAVRVPDGGGQQEAASRGIRLALLLDGAISLADLTYYMNKRVEELTGGAQAAYTNQTGNLALSRILVGKRPE